MQKPVKPVVIPEKIHVIDMKILHGDINSPIDFNQDKIDDFESTYHCELSFNLEDKMVKTDFEVSLKTTSEPDTNSVEATSNFKFAFFYYIENLNDLAAVTKEDTIDLKGGLEGILASITYSTSRGILMTRFQGTALSDFILPVINPDVLLKRK